MASVTNVLDPAEKLSQLHQWMLDNKVNASPRKPSTNTWEKAPTSSAADAEVEDFRQWIQDIQNHNRPALAW